MDDDRKASSDNQDSFDKRLKSMVREMAGREAQGRGRGSAYFFGVRLATDLLAGVLGGFALGWGLDYWLGTSPWLLLTFTLLGMVAGIMNVIRAASSAEAKRHLERTDGEGLPRVEDEDD